MYFWKCWRDTRGFFFVGLTLVVLAAAFVVVASALRYSNETGWSLIHGDTPERIRWIWRSALKGMGALGILVLPLLGLVLGSRNVGNEFKPGSLEFLLTRPRRRRYFLWAGWAIGAGELLLMCLLAVPVALGVLLYLTGSVYSWRILAFVPLLFTAGAVTYGLTYFLTVLARSGHYGESLSFGVIFAYLFFYWALHTYWRIDLPGWWELFHWAPGRPSLSPSAMLAESFPTAQLAGWSLLAAAFPLAAQLLFERAEV